MRISATYRCDNCGLEEFVEGLGLPKGWGASRWTAPVITRPPGYYAKEPVRPPDGTVMHVCSGNCRRQQELKCRGEIAIPEEIKCPTI